MLSHQLVNNFGSHVEFAQKLLPQVPNLGLGPISPHSINPGSTRVDLGPIDPDCPINPEPSDLLRTVVGAAESVGATSVGEAVADQVMGWRQARDVSSQGPNTFDRC